MMKWMFWMPWDSHLTGIVEYYNNFSSSNILLWAKFINAEQKEEFDMIAEKDPYIESAYQKLQVISQDKQKRMEYEAREKAVRDHNQFIYEAEQRGMELGIKEGQKQGIEKGIAAMYTLLMDMNTPYPKAIDIISSKFDVSEDFIKSCLGDKI